MKAKVYFTKNITPQSLVEIYGALGRELGGRTAVKISTGEPGGHNYLKPALIAPLVSKLGGTIVECGTAYGGGRDDPKAHREVIKAHGFSDIAPCEIMDEESEMELAAVPGGILKGVNIVGSGLARYDSVLMLSHFKGHAMGGFGGALKNMSIGIASRRGKAWIHSAGRTTVPEECWSLTDDQDGFLEGMAEACKAVADYVGTRNLAYINVANRLSVDCDCDGNPAEPEMADIGVFASLDPVALDRCCYDTVMNSADQGKRSLVMRMLDRHAIHTVERAEELGMGTTDYEIVSLD